METPKTDWFKHFNIDVTDICDLSVNDVAEFISQIVITQQIGVLNELECDIHTALATIYKHQK